MTTLLSPGTALFVARNALRALAWLRQRPNALPPHAWYGSGGASLLAASLLFVVGANPWWLPLAPLAPAVAAAGPSVAWMAARRSRGKPVVFIARFVDEDPEHSSIAAVHLKQVERRLLRNQSFMSAFDVRYINAPVKERHAQRLLRWTHAPAVVSGSGLLVHSHVRWEGWLLLRWPQTVGRSEGEFGLSDVSFQLSDVR